MVLNNQLSRSLIKDNKIKSQNKHMKKTAKNLNLNLLKKSKGMILGLFEIIDGSDTMKYTTFCCSSYAELYIISKHVIISSGFRNKSIETRNLKSLY